MKTDINVWQLRRGYWRFSGAASTFDIYSEEPTIHMKRV